jgi:hypothetical protein
MKSVDDGLATQWRAAGPLCHRLSNVLDKLAQRLHPHKRVVHEMMYAECRTDCETATSRFETENNSE